MGPTADLFPLTLPAGTLLQKNALSPDRQAQLLKTVEKLAETAPFSHATTKSGGVYSAEMTSCGDVGWWSDRLGTRYCAQDPRSGKPWPDMPKVFSDTVTSALSDTEWSHFEPDACLINTYEKGAKMGLHQDKDEADFSQPIVTVCLGATADFLIGGQKRSDKPMSFLVESGDILIMGGASRLRFHGIRKIYPDTSPIAGLAARLSLTFRKAI